MTGKKQEETVPSKLRDWFVLFRPWSFTATAVPFLLAAALVAHVDPACRPYCWLRWTFGLVSGLLFQATVNLFNTWGDARSGVDNVPGAICTTPQIHEGRVSARAVFAAGAGCAALAAAIGCALCFYAVPPSAVNGGARPVAFCLSLFAVGVLGALGSTNYTTGITFKYRGLGVPFVSVLMGPLELFAGFAVAAPHIADRLAGRFLTLAFSFPSGTGMAISRGLLLAALVAPVALLVGVIMHGNDMRDIASDRLAGIRTCAMWMGPRRALGYYLFCHFGAYVPPLFFAVCGFARSGRTAIFFLLPLLALPLSIRTVRRAVRVYRADPTSPKWRALERDSGGIHFVFGVLYALAVGLAIP